MANNLQTQTFINFPRQKLSESQKTDDWYKSNVDHAENILIADDGLRNTFRNKQTNYNLAANIINVNDFQKYINPDDLDLDSLPATFQHIGIENSKINLLLGEYHKRKKDFRAYISSNDQEGISRKEEELMKILNNTVNSAITEDPDLTPEEIEEKLQEYEKYSRYDFQDVAEITANKILKKEYKEQDFNFLFLRTFEDLLRAGEEIVYCSVLGGEPVMRRVDPRNIYTLGGNSMNIEDSDVIVEYLYQSVGQVIDDYWDKLKPKDIEYLETGNVNGEGGIAIGRNKDLSIYDFFGESTALEIFHPNERSNRNFGGAFDAYGNVRVLKVCWRTRRKIGKRKYFDQDGEEQYDYVDEKYKPNKNLGESVTWHWVNEWLEGTKIADNVYVDMKPVPFSSKSIVNKSKGTPPYIGSVNSTNGYRVQSLTDIMKPLAYSYDIAYYKRELEIATYKGNFAAINASLIPSGWKPEEWIRYITVNKFGFLDPTNEILKGPSQGKSAGSFNTLTATNVNIGDPQAIQMYTNILLDIEQTLGKIAGVTGAREGQIQSREAVGNVEREVAQTSHITEKWFAIDANFRKRALSKFLEVCKYAYKLNPKKAQFLLDDMGTEMIQYFDEFASTEMDIHISNSGDDTRLYEEIKQLSQAAIQNGQAKISDLIEIAQSESVQEIARKLRESSERIQKEQQEREQQQQQAQQQMQQAELEQKEREQEREDEKDKEELEFKYAELESKEKIEQMKLNAKMTSDRQRIDSDGNGIRDDLDRERIEAEKEHKQATVELKEKELEERKRANKAKEAISRKKTASK